MKEQLLDVVVVGGGPAGATAAHGLAQLGHQVALLDKAGRIKPCGGAIPPRLMRDFDIPDELLCARINSARMVSPSARYVDMPIDAGFVGMVNREVFDEFLRTRAAAVGATRVTGTYERIERDDGEGVDVHYKTKQGERRVLRAKMVIGAVGGLSLVARQEVHETRPPYVFAYHEIIRAPEGGFDGTRCDVIYDGATSPDFYGWVFPHGRTVSVGTGSAIKGFKIRRSVAELRQKNGLHHTQTIRQEGAPIPMKPLKRWDNGRDVLLAGDAAGVVAPS
ncbi:MAG: geranylgeranyl reductase family protein, partial [Myxococcota bacterium]